MLPEVLEPDTVLVDATDETDVAEAVAGRPRGPAVMVRGCRRSPSQSATPKRIGWILVWEGAGSVLKQSSTSRGAVGSKRLLALPAPLNVSSRVVGVRIIPRECRLSEGLTMVAPAADENPLELAIAAELLVSIGLWDASFESVLQRLTVVTKRTVPGAAEVSVTMVDPTPVTVASTAQFAVAVDECQYEVGYGPCLDALRFGVTTVVDDQVNEPRWPQYSPKAAAAGVRSSVAVPLMIEDRHLAALNVYGTVPRAFDREAISAAERLAEYAGVVVRNAEMYFSAQSRAQQMSEAMASRAVIEQAKGILIGGRGCNADEAFAILVGLSQQTGRKLHVIATALVDQAIKEAAH
jgi:GAF domain-containing protein